MSRNAKISIALVVVAIAAIGGIAMAAGGDETATSGDSTTTEIETPTSLEPDDERLVRPDSPRLSNGRDATFVEFLDFACEACGALYPTIEELRSTYGDRVTFVVRYLTLHPSSEDATRAAEAARAQDRFEDMYKKLFSTQAEWGESQTSERDRFFSYAQELGLDMAAFERDYDSAETTAMIEQSKADARALGVTGTPTLYLDGDQLRPKTVEDLVASLDAAVASN